MIAYLVTYNTPDQLYQSLAKNWPLYKALDMLYIIDNSDIPELINENNSIIDLHVNNRIPVQVIHQGINVGIGPARKFAADHFLVVTNHKYMMYLEDDFLLTNEGYQDQCGFKNNINPGDLVRFSEKVMQELSLDYFKLCFQEVFGNNSQSWAYKNMYPEKKYLFFDVKRSNRYRGDIEKVAFDNIHIIEGTPIATGEIFYGNWPQIMSRALSEYAFPEGCSTHEVHLTAESGFWYHGSRTFRSAVLLGTTFAHKRTQSYEPKTRKEV